MGNLHICNQGEESSVGCASIKNNKRSRKKAREITITCINELEAGLLEKTLANIYGRKVKNMTLKIK